MADVKELLKQAADEYAQKEAGRTSAPAQAAPAAPTSRLAQAAAEYQRASAPQPAAAAPAADTRSFFDKMKDRLLLRDVPPMSPADLANKNFPLGAPTGDSYLDSLPPAQRKLGPTPLDRTVSGSLDRAIRNRDVSELIPGARQGRIAATAALNGLNGWKGGPAGMAANAALSEFGQDENWQGAAGGLLLGQTLGGLGGKILGPTPALAGAPPPLPQSWQRAATQAGVESLGQVGGYLGGTYAGGNELPDPSTMALMAALSAAHVAHSGRTGAIQNSPGAVSETAIRDIGARQGRATPSDLVGGKNQFSALPMPGPDGTAALPMAAPNVMQAVMDHLGDIGRTTANGVKAAARAASPGQSLGAINAAATQPKPGPQPVAPQQAPAAAPEPPDDQSGSPLAKAASALNKAMANRLNKGVKGAKGDEYLGMLRRANEGLDDLGSQHAMIDAARQIKPDEFDVMSEFASKVAHDGRPKALAYWQSAKPDKLAQLQDAYAAVGQRLGITPDEAEKFAYGLSQVRAKVSGQPDWSKVNHGTASAVPLEQALDVAEQATKHPNARPLPPPQANATTEPTQAATAQPKPVPAAEPKPKAGAKPDRTVQDFESFINGGFGGGTFQSKGTTASTGGATLPGAASTLGTAGFEPGVQRAAAAQTQAAASELANSTQSPAARTAGPAEPPARELPVAAEKLGTAGFDPQAQMAEDAAFQSEQAKADAARQALDSTTQGPAARSGAPVETGPSPAHSRTVGTAAFTPEFTEAGKAQAAQKQSAARTAGYAEPPIRTGDPQTRGMTEGTEPPPAAQRQGTSGYDTRPYDANPGKTQKQLDAEKATAAKEDAKAAKVAETAAKAKAKPTDQQALDELMGKAYDGGKRTFRSDLAEKLREHERLNPGTLHRATNGNADRLLSYADNLTTVWNRWGKMVEPNGQSKGVFRAWFSLLPELGHIRVGHDIPHYFNSVAADTQIPTSRAYQTLRYLAEHPETPKAYVMEALRSLNATKTDDRK